jgi:hypothetical protein
MPAWTVELHAEVDAWFLRLAKEDPETADLIEQAVDMLAVRGPTLGRPLVDRIKGSIFHNMKELRPASVGCSEVRILFAFDPMRHAILLVAGDKAGNWREWYSWSIPTADGRYTKHLADLAAVEGRK